MTNTLKEYLSHKHSFEYRGKRYYKLKNYKHTYYVAKEDIDTLTTAPKEIILEKNQKLKTPHKGLAKWDSSRKRIVISEDKIKIYFQPFDVV